MNKDLRTRLKNYKDLYLANFRTKSLEDWAEKQVTLGMPHKYLKGKKHDLDEYNKVSLDYPNHLGITCVGLAVGNVLVLTHFDRLLHPQVVDCSAMESVSERLNALSKHCRLNDQTRTSKSAGRLIWELDSALVGDRSSIDKSSCLDSHAFRAWNKARESLGVSNSPNANGCLVCQLAEVCRPALFGWEKPPMKMGAPANV